MVALWTVVIIPIATLILSVFLGAWLNAYLTRPKLEICGNGSGGCSGPGYYMCHAVVRNSLGLLGISLKQTIIFGKRLHRPVEKGLTANRNPASKCTARILDKVTREHIAHLWWRFPESDRVQQWVDIGSNESCDLMLFARLDAEPSKYFIYQSKSDALLDVGIPPEHLKYHGTRRFIVQISYTHGRQKLEFDAAVQKHYGGRLTYIILDRGGSF